MSDQYNSENRAAPDPPGTPDGTETPVGDVYADVIAHLPNGVAYCRMLFRDGRPDDFVYLFTNPAFHAHTGLGAVVGKRVSEVIPGLRESNPQLFEIYGRVAAGGAPEAFEIFVEPLRQWFAVQVRSPKPDHFVAVFHGITARKQAQAALLASEQRMELALGGAELGLWDLDIASGSFASNPRLVAMMGYVPGEFEINAETLLALRHPDDAAKFDASVYAHLKGQTPIFEAEYRMRHQDGHWVWIHSRGKVVERDDSGRAMRMTGTNLDISERKRAQEALQTSEARFRLLSAATFEGIAVTEQGRFVDANDQLLSMLGYRREELIGLPVADLLPAEDRERVLDSIRSGCESHIEHAMIGKDGRHVQVEAQGQTSDREGRAICITALRDISERKRVDAELEQHRHHLEELVRQRTAALMETEAKASHILQSSADGLFGVDHEGTITFINPAACALLGYSAEQAIGRCAHTLFHHSKPDGSTYPAETCPSHMAMLRSQQIRVDNEVYWHADGHAVPVMYAVHPMIRNGVNTGAVVSLVDMSEQRAAAEAREQALSAAQELARVKSEFLANMSHEIRTPLNGLLGFANIGQRNYRDSEKARRAFAKILSSGNILLGVINDILDFSKIEAGKIQIEQTEVSLLDVINAALELVADRARDKGLDLRVELAADLPRTCSGDPVRMSQILLNLLSNAVKFTEAGSVTVTVLRQGAELVFRVADTGIGISDAQRAALFRPFHQADGSTTRKFGGTGLGLAITKRMLELMGGEIRLETRPGLGSTFEFRLPYVEADAATAERIAGRAEATAAARQPLQGIAILVAEDDAISRMVLEEELSDAGAEVVLAGDGREALDRVIRDGRAAYDVILMDIQMPELDGYQATRRILELAPDLPIIGQTAHAFGEERDKCFAAGMVAHIAKPIDPETLVELVRTHVARKRGT